MFHIYMKTIIIDKFSKSEINNRNRFFKWDFILAIFKNNFKIAYREINYLLILTLKAVH